MGGIHWGKGTIGLQAAVPKRPHTQTFCPVCSISCQNEKAVTVKIKIFLQITVIINGTLNSLKSKNTLG